MKYLVAFVTASFNIGNYQYDSKKINVDEIKDGINKEWGHDPKQTIILNIMSISA
jgi:hypothetical protein